jgi:hypothetical protein
LLADFVDSRGVVRPEFPDGVRQLRTSFTNNLLAVPSALLDLTPHIPKSLIDELLQSLNGSVSHVIVASESVHRRLELSLSGVNLCA